MKKYFSVLIYFVFLTVLTYSENFRVHDLHKINYSQEFSERKIKMNMNDALFIELPEELLLVKGLSLEIKIPKDVAMYRDSVAYSFYKNISPSPKPNSIDYYGERYFINTFPGRLSYNLQIPLVENAELKKTPYNDVIPFNNQVTKGVFFRLQLVMKGVMESFGSEDFTVTVTPIFSNEGILDINFIHKKTGLSIEKKDISVFFDEIPLDLTQKPIIVPAGEHFISVSSLDYRTEMQKVAIEEGLVTHLDVELKDIIPELTVLVPDSVEVFLDDTKIQTIGEAFPITEGNHIVKFVLGSYETIKTFTATKGNSYNLSFVIDVLFLEE